MSADPRKAFATDRATLWHGDCADIASVIAPDSIDAIVTDPPAGISFMGKAWDGDKGGRDQWIAWLRDIMRTAMGLLKPGGHALVWALPRTSHWTATAIEDAGFEIRDVVVHLFGTGFPKLLDVIKAIDDAAGAKRSVVGEYRMPIDSTAPGSAPSQGLGYASTSTGGVGRPVTAPATPDAARFAGYGTALKPASEHWILARKPLAGTVAANAIAYGTGGLRIDDCRIGGVETIAEMSGRSGASTRNLVYGEGIGADGGWEPSKPGRFPANVTLDEEAARSLDEMSGMLHAPVSNGSSGDNNGVTWKLGGVQQSRTFSDSGGASRFFYVAKATRAEKDAGLDHLPLRTGGDATDREEGSAGLNSSRAGSGRTGGVRNHHPTVKSIALMRWLCRLITPPGGIVLDLFAGSGTTGLAALAEGLRFVGVEREAEFVDIAAGRLAHVECVAVPEMAQGDAVKAEPSQPSLFGSIGGAR